MQSFHKTIFQQTLFAAFLLTIAGPAYSQALTAPAAPSPDPSPVLIELQVIQLDAAGASNLKTPLSGTGEMNPSRAPADPPAGQVMVLPDRETRLEIGGQTLRFVNGKLAVENGVAPAAGGQNTDAPNTGATPFKVLSAPRILVAVNQEASLTMGRKIPYMVPRADGSLVVEESDDITEGLSISLTIATADEREIAFKNLTIKTSAVVSRQPLPNVPFEVGRPVLRSTETTAALKLKAGQTGLITMARAKADDPAILVLLSAKLQMP